MPRRFIRAIAALLLLTYFHPALGEDKAQQNRAVVEALFAAVAGTTTEEERALREDMTKEENVLRDAQNAAYRARALPWLMASLGAAAATASDEDPEIPWDPTDAYALFGTTRAGFWTSP